MRFLTTGPAFVAPCVHAHVRPARFLSCSLSPSHSIPPPLLTPTLYPPLSATTIPLSALFNLVLPSVLLQLRNTAYEVYDVYDVYDVYVVYAVHAVYTHSQHHIGLELGFRD